MLRPSRLSNFIDSQVESIQVVDQKTLKPRSIVRKGIREFIKKYGDVLMSHSREGGYFYNAAPVEGFTSIILKAR